MTSRADYGRNREVMEQLMTALGVEELLAQKEETPLEI